MATKTTVEVFKEKDKGLVASFQDFEVTCNVISTVDVHWNSSLTKQDGDKSTSSALLVDFNYVNSCTGDNLLMSGFLQPANGTEANDLSTGHVDGVVTVTTDPDVNPTVLTANLTVNVNFAANGPATSFHDKSKTKGGGVTTVSDVSGSSRPGVAHGTISGILPLMTGPKFVNLLNGPSASAQLEKDANGTITITKKTK
ncbi:MAG TPA: hypothetical protein VGL59_19480 [Polyangia bacterium]